jgi:hypothetical protein
MAKKKKDKKDGAQAEAVDSIRAAIERGLQMSAEGAQATRERTRELVDEIASAAGRVRQSLEDMRVLDELRRLRNEIETLGARVTALERPGPSAAKSTSTSAASAAKPAASRASTTRSRAKKTTAARKATSSRKPAAKSSTAKKTTSTRSRAKKATTKPSTSS